MTFMLFVGCLCKLRHESSNACPCGWVPDGGQRMHENWAMWSHRAAQASSQRSMKSPFVSSQVPMHHNDATNTTHAHPVPRPPQRRCSTSFTKGPRSTRQDSHSVWTRSMPSPVSSRASLSLQWWHLPPLQRGVGAVVVPDWKQLCVPACYRQDGWAVRMGVGRARSFPRNLSRPDRRDGGG